LFEVGLGAGGQSLSQPAFDLEPGTALTLAQHLRIGARDGLMLEGLSYVALFHSRFNFAMLRIVGQIPVGETSWLMVGGGGGLLGLGYGEIGLRLLLSGNGDRESFFLTTAVGGLNVFKSWPCLTPAAFIPVNGFNSASTCKQSIDYAGPMLGVGGEWRL
jgi:hypothetical protein